MIARPFALVGFSFVFALLALSLVEGSAAVLLVAAVGCILLAVFLKTLPERATYIVSAMGVIAACVSFISSERLVYSPALSFIGEELVIKAEVDDIQVSSSAAYYTLSASEIDGKTADCKLRLYQNAPLNAQVGDTVEFVGDVKSVGQTDESHSYYKSKGVFLSCTADHITVTKAQNKSAAYYIYRIKEYIALTLGEYIDGDSGDIAVSMLTGDKVSLSSQINNAFKVCGLSHTLAVSGLHMNIIVLALYKLLCLISKRLGRFAAALCIPVAVFYAAVSGFSVSAVRAGIMIIVILFGRLISRRGDSLNSLGLAALIITLVNPYAVLDWSFMLSFSSTLGIILFSPLLKKADRAVREKIRIKFVSGIAVSLFDAVTVSTVATAFTLPVMILFVGSFSLMFAPANLAVFWAVPVMMVSSALTALLSLLPISFPAQAAAFVGKWTGRYILAVVNTLSQPTLARVSIDSAAMKIWLAAVLIVIALAVFLMKNKKRAYVFCSVFVCASLVLTGGVYAAENKGSVNITAVDVDDGACFIVSYGTAAVLIGCSGDEYVVSNVLDELGVIRIELAVVPLSTDKGNICFDGLEENYIVERVADSCDSLDFDFHGRAVKYISNGVHDYCYLSSNAGSALFVFGTDTPRELIAENAKADFLFSRAQPPLWIDTAEYTAAIISADGNTVVNSDNVYSTYDNSHLTLRFNEWGKYKINR